MRVLCSPNRTADSYDYEIQHRSNIVLLAQSCPIHSQVLLRDRDMAVLQLLYVSRPSGCLGRSTWLNPASSPTYQVQRTHAYVASSYL